MSNPNIMDTQGGDNLDMNDDDDDNTNRSKSNNIHPIQNKQTGTNAS